MIGSTNTPPMHRLVWQSIQPFWERFLILMMVLFGSTLAELLAPQALRTFLDSAQAGAANATLWAAGGFILLATINRVLSMATSYVGHDLGWRATNRLRIDLTKQLLALDLGFHKQHTPGALIERVDGDCEQLGNLFSQLSLRLISNSMLAIGILLLLFREDWRVGAGLSGYALITLAVLFRLQHSATARYRAHREAETAMLSFVEERMAAAEDLRSNGAEQYSLDQLSIHTERMIGTARQATMAGNRTFVSSNALFLVGYTIGLAAGSLLYLGGSVSIGSAFLIVYYIGMLARPLEGIREQVQDLQQASASIDRIRDLLGQPLRLTNQGQARLGSQAAALTIKQLSFSYQDEPTAPEALVLEDLNLHLPAGQILGLLGRTGSGKSSLARLIARLYDPQQGALQLDGIDLRDLDLHHLRQRIGFVTQDVQIFQASVRENLTLFCNGISDQQIETALAELGLLDWLRQLPHGLDTQLGAGGVGLSAGEAQLLAFARIFLRNPGLIILDEASSRLDPATERRLEQAITRLLVGRTAVIIAHRLSTVQRADQILILDQGRIAEYGQRTTLMANPHSQLRALLSTGMEDLLA
ncbi:MAG: ABC transporter ATP-binding protein [Roseiflexaceae bacterium]